jgi:hypothetical protein
MTTDLLRQRAKALRLYGLLAHWTVSPMHLRLRRCCNGKKMSISAEALSDG